MPKRYSRVDNDVLVKAGLALVSKIGNPLTKQPSRGRSMIYRMQSGDSVRIRTCNDHVLVVIADDPQNIDSKLNIQGTDWLLIVMPEIQRTAGRVISYLVPTDVAVEAVRKSHQAWIDSEPDTHGENTTWNLWFDISSSYSGTEARTLKHEFERRWEEYRLKGSVLTSDFTEVQDDEEITIGGIKAEIEIARRRIAHLARVEPQAVKISVNFS